MNASKKKNIEAIYPLSPMQQGMLFHSILDSESDIYFEQTLFKVRGKMNPEAFKKALQIVVDRNPILRTAFVYKKLEQSLQVVHKVVDLPLTVEDWRSFSQEEQQTRLNQFVSAERKKGFKFSKAPLFRLALLQLEDDLWQVVWSNHHILLDGWSMPQLFQEIFAFYEGYAKGIELNLPPRRPYRDYIQWLQKQDLKKAESFWKETLQGFYAPTSLPYYNWLTEEEADETGYLMETLEIGEILSQQLEQAARKHQLTLNTLVQGAWAILLHRFNNENDVLFGATVSGRPPELEGVEQMIGLFINTLPVRVQIDPEQSLLSLFQNLQKQAVASREFEYTPLAEIHVWSDVPGHTELFRSIVVFENYPIDQTMEERQKVSDLKFFDFKSHERTNYPITLVAGSHNNLVLEIAYEKSMFQRQFIRWLLDQMQLILRQFVADPFVPLRRLTLVTPADTELLTKGWNQTERDIPSDRCVHHLFEDQVKKRPDAIAVQFGEKTMSYAALNEKANRLAHFLIQKGVKAEDRIAIYIDRSFDMIIAIMAVLKAGAAYVPIDTTYPQERVRFILEDSRCKWVLTDNASMASLPEDQNNYLSLNSIRDALNDQPTGNPNAVCFSKNLAYIIYTSGSTGKPKGTLLQHLGAVNTTLALGEIFELKPGRNILQFATIGFDASVPEILGSLTNGATVQLVSREVIMSPEELAEWLRNQKINTAILPPSVLAIVSSDDLPDLKVIGSAGEACNRDIVRKWSRKGRRFINGYGPTESTVSTSLYEIEDPDKTGINVPIGSPMANTRVYVLDSALNPQPVGFPGELHIAGIGLARGYLNRPELSAEKFIPDPFSRQVGERMYRSGDLVRWRPDGNLEFLGRIDHQVKLRGFRIELDEIENVIIDFPGIRDAFVMMRGEDENEKYLAAYIVWNDNRKSGLEDLRAFMKDRLPDYMIPSAFMELDALPLTPSGKVNWRALPAPREDDRFTAARIAPRNPTEEILVNIWKDILKLPEIGINENFFDLGGHSLMATQVLARIRGAFEVELPLKEFFASPVISDLALLIEREKMRARQLSAPPLKRVKRPDRIPLSFSQQRLWFLDQLAPGLPNYNLPSALRLKGNLNVEALERAIRMIISRHESLRTTFKHEKGEAYQQIEEEFSFNLPIEDLSDLPESEREAKALQIARSEAAAPFNLETGPLFRVKLLKMDENEHIILFTMHHIISDGWSMGVLVNEFTSVYDKLVKGESVELPEPPIQYSDYAVWQREWLKDEALKDLINFWEQELGKNPPPLELPTDKPRPAMQTFNGKTLQMQLPKNLSEQLAAFSQKEGVTLFMTLLAAFQTLLHRYTGQNQILVGSPIANRPYTELESLIGFFVNTLIFKADFSQSEDFRSLLKQVRERTLKAYAHQALPFEHLVDALQPERDMSHSPLFQVAFILQNVPFEKLELTDLSVSPLSVENTTSKYDLTVNAVETPEGLILYFEYNTDLFEEETVRRWQKHFRILLEKILQKPKTNIHQIDFLPGEEKQKLLTEWNATKQTFPDGKTVHGVFYEQVLRNPDRPAVVMNGQTLSYLELDRKANQLANFLVKKGLRVDNIAGISMERHPDMVISILGILKAGGAFLNIDPAYPKERVEYMISDSGIDFLLSHSNVAENLPVDQTNIFCLDTLWEEISAESDKAPEIAVESANLAYVIYTSGSTGKPKGTMLAHRGLCNLSAAQRQAFNINEQSRILQFASLSFDASVWETVMALLNGAALVLTSQENLTTGQGLLNVLKEQKVTIVTLPPSVLAVTPFEALPDLKTIVTAGEKCTTDLVKRWAEGRQFVNAYGPTETTVCASMYETSPADDREPPIGKPIPNFQLYVLDAHWQLLPIGIPGELCVGGVGLARGYLNRPDLTANAFIPNPFGDQPGERLYRTGDLVRCLPDGNIQFLGRIDHQIKFRGFRIELGEIEAVLTSHPLVRDAAVVLHEPEPGNQRLAAYYVSAQGEELNSAELKDFLRKQLPEYMVPSLFTRLDQMPLSPSGKVDRKALPKPELVRDALSGTFVAPRNEIEERLTQIAAELLHIDRVGVFDNFFELGGHSLLATRFIATVSDEFGVEIPLRRLFETPTVASIAEIILSPEAQAKKGEIPQIERQERGEQDLDALLQQLDQLSDEEVKELLKNQQNNDNDENETSSS